MFKQTIISMNNVKSLFSIKDLENLSGIKAHTIRIWEKRYKLLTPNRTDTNIRFYDLKNLQKLMNVTLLYNNGLKISKISILSDDQIKTECRGIISDKAVKNLFINDLKLAMINFDYVLFESSYQRLIKVIDFKEIYISYFIPFLHEIGLLWHTDTINPAHEHFITSLIKQKILVNIEMIQGVPPTRNDNRFILFLPENEIHELGLTYINYEIMKKGYPSIYLGQSTPISSLKSFLNYDDKITFVTYFTVKPSTDKIPEYLNEIYNEIISKCNSELWVLGRKVNDLGNIKIPSKIKLIKVTELIKIL